MHITVSAEMSAAGRRMKGKCTQECLLMKAPFKFPIRWSSRMSSQNLMAHTVWMECGNSATPPSPCPSTGATASCLQSSVSPLLCSGASCLRAFPSATSGLWFPASRAVWLSRSASAASTLSASRPSAIPSLKPWARSSAACALHCAKKSKNSHSSGYSMFFLHHKIGPGILLAPLILLLSSHAAPHPPTRELTCPVGLLPPEAQWQLQHGSVTGLALLEGSVLLTEGERGPPAMIWGSVHPHLSLKTCLSQKKQTPRHCCARGQCCPYPLHPAYLKCCWCSMTMCVAV